MLKWFSLQPLDCIKRELKVDDKEVLKSKGVDRNLSVILYYVIVYITKLLASARF